MRNLIIPALLPFLLSTQISGAGPIRFSDDWKSLEFFRIPATQYLMKGQSVEITARKSSSVIYRPLNKADWQSTRATWSWETIKSVSPTDLSKKGEDDRNISIYFVFLDTDSAERIGRSADIKDLLTNDNARILIYSFGGDKPRNTVQKNPYLGKRGVTIIKRAAAPGAFKESVNLSADYQRAFNASPNALVGIAVASDSDDTKGLVVARIAGLEIE